MMESNEAQLPKYKGNVKHATQATEANPMAGRPPGWKPVPTKKAKPRKKLKSEEAVPAQDEAPLPEPGTDPILVTIAGAKK